METLEDRIAADAPTWPANRDRLDLRLLGFGRSKLLHRTEHLAQWRRCHVVGRPDATTHHLCAMMPSTRSTTHDHEGSAVRRLSWLSRAVLRGVSTSASP